MIGIIVDGEPAVKERPRCAGNLAYTAQRTKDAEQAIGWQWRVWHPEGPIAGSRLSVRLLFYTRSSRKDADNMAKLVLDALNGVAWEDDRQIDHLEVEVFRGTRYAPSTDIRVTPLREASGE